jgi:hypothetical protein
VHCHRLHTLSLALAALLWIAVVPEAAAQSPQRIGVVVTTVVNVDENEVDALAGELGQALEQSLGVVVTAGAETRRRLPSGGLSEGCIGDATCREDLGERLDADELLMLVVARVGNRVQIDATWVDVASGKLASRPAVVLEAGADRAAVLRGASQTLLPHLQPVPTLSDVRAPTPAPTEEPRPRLVRRGHHMTAGTWIMTGITVAALGGSLGLGYLNMTQYGELEDDSACLADPTCFAGEKETLERNALVADGLGALSAVAGITALILYFSSDELVEVPAERADARRPAPRRPARPLVGLGAGSDHFQISVGGAF